MRQEDVLKELVASVSSRTLAARLRAVMPEVDQRVRDGVRYDEIIAVLNANGFVLNRNTFRSYLYRYRKKAVGDVGRPPAQAPLAVTVAAPLSNPPVREPGNAPSRECSDLESVLDRARRNEIGEEYLARQRPILKSRK